VKGLNTSATLWCSACVGLFVGAGLFIPGFVLTGFIITANLALRPIVIYINSRTPVSDELEAHYTVSLACSDANASRLRATILNNLGTCAAHLKNLTTAHTGEGVQISADFVFPTRVDARIEKMAGHIGAEPGVVSISWHIRSGSS
jgi:putative Mg2+ transporter-C (MgtC) family protein